MRTFNIYIAEYDWLVRVYVGVRKLNTNSIMRSLREFGCSVRNADEAFELLYKGKKNCGLCFSNPMDRVSVMVLSVTTSAREFFNSVVHEISHLACHIATEDGIDLHGEELCYLTGDTARAMYPYMKDLLCCNCHE